MGERTYVLTYCDGCNLAEDSHAEGYFMGSFNEAQKGGWKECDYGIQCPGCAAAEDMNNQQEEAEETFHGASLEAASAIAQIVQLTQPVTPKKRGRPRKTRSP